MNEILKNEIIALCSVMSVSGFEPRSADLLRQSVGNHFDETMTDAVGNHIFWKRSQNPSAPTVLIDAHFDEIGMVVTKHLENGFLKLAPVGGLSPSVLQGADVVVYGTETLRGVIVSTPPHLRSGGDDRLPDLADLMVDTGYSTEELKTIAPVGTPVGFAPHYSQLSGDCLAGKSFDNKACAAIAAYAIAHTPKERLAANVALLFSCYEETSPTGGAAVATFGIEPDYAMVIDVNLATVPDTPKSETVPLGKGVSLSLSAATDRRLTRMTRALCENREIPHTVIASPASTGTNATAVNLVKGGVPVVDVGLPLRNMHTYNEVISMTDAEALFRLVEQFICSDLLAQTFGGDGREELPQ
ncbi:MAG: M20/M25/M40 family metallo-hydrolase [Clostridia bacterium]|nr:M20/M25/M40 family metallo-hydrolase [Clostridia bacterium]